MKYKYTFMATSHMRVEQILSFNNRTEDAIFWSEIFDDNHPESFYFSSFSLNELTDDDDIIKRAYQIIAIFEGIFKLCEKRYEKYFTLNSLFFTESKKLISRRIDEPELYLIDFDISQLNNSNTTSNPVYDLFANIIRDEYLTNLFFLLSKKIDYKLLYMIYDDIGFYLHQTKDRKFLQEFKTELDIFKHTANNYEVLGYFARHGRNVQHPPKKIMALDEAKELLFKIIEKLLREKFSILIPQL
jgi:hypothetical protein